MCEGDVFNLGAVRKHGAPLGALRLVTTRHVIELQDEVRKYGAP